MSQDQTAISSAAVTKWGALGYQPVPGLANRFIARYLRAQRRNMLRFFLERGMFDLAGRMAQIKESRQGMMAKNRMFQAVLDLYAARTMQTQATVSGPMEPLLDVRSAESQEMAASTSGQSEISNHTMASKKPPKSPGNILQEPGIPNSDAPYIEEM